MPDIKVLERILSAAKENIAKKLAMQEAVAKAAPKYLPLTSAEKLAKAKNSRLVDKLKRATGMTFEDAPLSRWQHEPVDYPVSLGGRGGIFASYGERPNSYYKNTEYGSEGGPHLVKFGYTAKNPLVVPRNEEFIGQALESRLGLDSRRTATILGGEPGNSRGTRLSRDLSRRYSQSNAEQGELPSFDKLADQGYDSLWTFRRAKRLKDVLSNNNIFQGVKVGTTGTDDLYDAMVPEELIAQYVAGKDLVSNSTWRATAALQKLKKELTEQGLPFDKQLAVFRSHPEIVAAKEAENTALKKHDKLVENILATYGKNPVGGATPNQVVIVDPQYIKGTNQRFLQEHGYNYAPEGSAWQSPRNLVRTLASGTQEKRVEEALRKRLQEILATKNYRVPAQKGMLYPDDLPNDLHID
jgi:hypothetical protein